MQGETRWSRMDWSVHRLNSETQSVFQATVPSPSGSSAQAQVSVASPESQLCFPYAQASAFTVLATNVGAPLYLRIRSDPDASLITGVALGYSATGAHDDFTEVSVPFPADG